MGTYNTMMDSYITGRSGITTGGSYTHLATITATSYQLYPIDNIDQYNAIAFYLLYPGSKAIVECFLVPIELFKTTTSANHVQPTYYNAAGYHYGSIYYGSTNSIYGMITLSDSVEVYGIK